MAPGDEGIWIIDERAKTVYANQRMAQILGTSPAELTGRDSFDFIFPEDAGEAERLFNAKKQGHSRPFRFKLRRKDGSAVPVQVQGTPLHNAAGDFTGIVGTFTQTDETREPGSDRGVQR